MQHTPPAFRVQEIVPWDHRREILDLFQRNLQQHQGEKQFAWTYARHPDGSGRAWILTKDSRILGFAAAFPRRLSGVDARAWLLGDFVVEREARALGPAVRLQRGLLEDLGRDPGTLVVDFPSRTMLGIYRWLKMEPNERYERWVLPLGPGSRARRDDEASGTARAALRTLAATWFRLRFATWSPGAGRVFELADEDRSEESFRSILAELPRWGSLRCARSRAHLEWVLARPVGAPPKLATVRRGGAVVGAAIHQPFDGGWMVLDYLEDPRTPPRCSVLAGVCAAAARAGAGKVVLFVTASSPTTKILKELGFRMRDATSTLVYHRREERWTEHEVAGAGFHWMQGDRDA